jgi:SnoaL-like domain
MRIPFLVFMLLFLTCVKPPPAVKPVEKVLSHEEQVLALLKSAYAAAKAGESEVLAELFTEDASIFGLGPTDTFDSRDMLLPYFREAFLPLTLGGSELNFSNSLPVVHVVDSKDSSPVTAIVSDFPRVTATRKEKDTTWLPRITAHAVKTENGFQFDALHVSFSLPDAVLSARDVNKRVLPPKDVLAQRGPDSDELVGLTKRVLSDYGVKVDRTSPTHFMQIGTSPTEVFGDGKAFMAMLKPQISGIKKAGYAFKLDGALRSKRTGKTGWVMSTVLQSVGTGKNIVTNPAFRVLWIYIEEDGLWNIASEHQSLPTREEYREAASEEELATYKAQIKIAETIATQRSAAEAKAAKNTDGGVTLDAGINGKKNENAKPKSTPADPGIGAW